MKKVLIVGAGSAGHDVLREINKSRDLGLKVVGFIDDDPDKLRKKLDGARVLGRKEDLSRILKKGGIDEVLIAIPSAHGERIYEYVKICSDARIAFRIVPRVKEIIEGRAYVRTLRKARVEDLLGRPVIKADVKDLKSFFDNRSVLITGAAGSIGSELSTQIAAYRPKLIVAVDQWEGGLFQLQRELSDNFARVRVEYKIADVRDGKRVQNLMEEFVPDFVFHAAAYKHVPLMETNPNEAVKNNVFGTENVARESKNVEVKRFVLVSTDKAANPKSTMGKTKLLAESIVNSFKGKTKFMTVRFGNVLDSYGSVVPTFREQIERGKPVTITDKRMTRYFMSIPEASQLILKAAKIGKGGELYILDMGQPVKIVDLAERIIRLSGYVPGEDIKIEFTGKRKGEKLHERLFTTKEGSEKTKEKKIFISQSAGIGAKELAKGMKTLRKLVQNKSSIRTIKELDRLTSNLRK